MNETVIIGAGGLGKEVLAMLGYMNLQHNTGCEVVGFLDDGLEVGTLVNGVGVLGKVDDHRTLLSEDCSVFIAIADPKIKKKIHQKLESVGYNFPNLIFPNTVVYDNTFVQMGKGIIIGAGCVLTTNIEIKDFVFININSVIGHDVSIGAYCSIMPGCKISGNVFFGHQILVGTNGTVLPGIQLGPGAIVGAGATVTRDVESGTVVVGTPALPME